MAHTNIAFESSRYSRILHSKSSLHAATRVKQRGLNQGCVSLILAFGVKEHDGLGGIRYMMTTSAMEKLFAATGRTNQTASLAGTYAVVSATDSTVITVGHRYS
jgi:hypothetical protein